MQNTTYFVEEAYDDVIGKMTTGIVFVIFVFFLEEIM